MEERLEGVNPEFFMWTYKTLWCPIGSFHDWQECIYAHNYQDLRRDPRIGYSTQVCPDWERANRSPTYGHRCPRGFGCGYAHGAKEQLYHPAYFHSVMCNDHFHGKGCPRGKTCAFFHKKKEKRLSPPWPDHGDAIPEPVLEAFLQPDIEFPPFAPAETGGRPRARDEDDETSGAPGELWLQMMLQAQAEIGADANANKLPDLTKMGWLAPARPRTPDENPQVSPNVLRDDDEWNMSKDGWPPVSNMSFKFRSEAEVFTPEPLDEPGRRNRSGGSRRRKKTTK
jgi:hypothetical protein